MDFVLDIVGRLDWIWIVVLALVQNVAILAFTLVYGERLIARNEHARITSVAPAATPVEWLAAMVTVLGNTALTVIGVALWRSGHIVVPADNSWRIVLDIAMIVLIFDLVLYVAHSVAHWPIVYALAHRFHHRYREPKPLTLFALHPLETIGFASMWLVFLWLWDTHALAIVVYAAFNTWFGLTAHLGVEPLPVKLRRTPIFAVFATSGFHAQHHMNIDVNKGFYTTIWDRLFGTIDPTYDDLRRRA